MATTQRASAFIFAAAAAVAALQLLPGGPGGLVAAQPMSMTSGLDVVLRGSISQLPGDPMMYKVLVFQQLPTGW